MKNICTLLIAAILAMLSIAGCSSAKGGKADTNAAEAAADSTAATVAIQFSADSALGFVKAQCDFGPRVPGTDAHRRCGDYLAAYMAACGANVINQHATLTAFDGTRLPARNIIAEFAPDSSRRILLLAHWDCRPWADHDPDPARRKEPVMGANDAASGVAVLMELARVFATQAPPVGIDLLLVDAEDWGNPGGDDDSWALGTQFWTASPHRSVSEYQYAILLDMVGTHNARFKKDYYSMAYAPDVMNFVWQTARENGLGDFFVNEDGFGITDDHLYINRAGIKCIDIIDQNNSGTGTGFFPQWHTTADDMGVISAATLRAVGTCLKALIGKY